MNINQFRKYMRKNTYVETNSEIFKMFHKLSQEALKITNELNNKYHSPEEIVEIMSKLTGKKVDKSFRLFPPFYSDAGKILKLGKMYL